MNSWHSMKRAALTTLVFLALDVCSALSSSALAQHVGSACTTQGAFASSVPTSGSNQVLWCNGSIYVLSEIYTTGAFVGQGMSAQGSNTNITLTPSGTGYLLVPSGNVGIGNVSPGALLDIGSAGATLGTMRLEGSASGYVQLQPNVAAGSWTMTLPTSGGTNGYVLQTDGIGITSWAANGAGATITLGTSASVTNPQRSGDPTTGLFSSSTNTVATSIGGTQQMTVNATGVGIGTASPAGLLHVGTGAGQAGYALNVTPNGGTAAKTAFLQDTTAATGKTKVIIKAGAADTFGDHQFSVQTNSGAEIAAIDASNAYVTTGQITSNSIAGTLAVSGAMSNSFGTGRYSVVIQNSSLNENHTSGTGGNLQVYNGNGGNFVVASGTGVFNSVSLEQTINQTGTATGVTRNLYLNPTITSAYDFRALETSGYTQNIVGTVPTTLQQILWNAPTLAAGSAKTVTNAATEVITAAPIAGTNVTITHPYSLWVQGGAARFDGNVGIGTTTPNATLDVNGAILNECATVSTLPSGHTGMRHCVTDATSCTFMSPVTGGGSTVCPVFYSGSAWVGG